MAKLAPGGEAVLKELGELLPLGRMGDAWDIAMACVYLTSPAGRYVSGDTLVVDGASWLAQPCLIPEEAVSRASRVVEGESRRVGLASKL